MATKRTPLRRDLRRRITAEAVAMYQRAVALQDTYVSCIRGEGCFSTKVGEHCPACREYIDLSRSLNRALGIRPWQSGPLDAAAADPPDYILNNQLQHDYWREAWALRYEILAALKKAGSAGGA